MIVFWRGVSFGVIQFYPIHQIYKKHHKKNVLLQRTVFVVEGPFFMNEIDSIESIGVESAIGNVDSEVQCTMLELLNHLDAF